MPKLRWKNVTFNKKGELIKMTKKEQLKVAFRAILKSAQIKKFGWIDDDDITTINTVVDTLITEVSIRTELK